MIECKTLGGAISFDASGSMPELLADITWIIYGVYSALSKSDKALADAYRGALLTVLLTTPWPSDIEIDKGSVIIGGEYHEDV